jgi:hypothetical protein
VEFFDKIQRDDRPTLEEFKAKLHGGDVVSDLGSIHLRRRWQVIDADFVQQKVVQIRPCPLDA